MIMGQPHRQCQHNKEDIPVLTVDVVKQWRYTDKWLWRVQNDFQQILQSLVLGYVVNHSAFDIFQSLDEINIDGTEYSNQSKLEQYTFNHYTIF